MDTHPPPPGQRGSVPKMTDVRRKSIKIIGAALVLAILISLGAVISLANEVWFGPPPWKWHEGIAGGPGQPWPSIEGTSV